MLDHLAATLFQASELCYLQGLPYARRAGARDLSAHRSFRQLHPACTAPTLTFAPSRFVSPSRAALEVAVSASLLLSAASPAPSPFVWSFEFARSTAGSANLFPSSAPQVVPPTCAVFHLQIPPCGRWDTQPPLAPAAAAHVRAAPWPQLHAQVRFLNEKIFALQGHARAPQALP